MLRKHKSLDMIGWFVYIWFEVTDHVTGKGLRGKMKLHYTFLVLSIVLSIINQLDIYTSKTVESDSHLQTCKVTQTTGDCIHVSEYA
jgi:succinate-acetate transporter protein